MLSRAGWNNVVIFSMLLMIFFLNGFHHKFFAEKSEHHKQLLLPAQSFVLALAYPGSKVERIGTSWRSEGEWQASPQQIETLLADWLQTELMTQDKPSELPAALSAAQFWLAGQELPWVIQVFKHEQQYYLFDAQRQLWFSAEASTVQGLFIPISLE
ncbi:hypothetical protein ACFOEE_18065 [Pseudoalteromonas fenneropenaei]|uniref:Orphan protein n=1 Tax=Pseudoalteromonas fenneropenaei TaxID=1737459 RepID=A0ABV7CPC8_9GAMM